MAKVERKHRPGSELVYPVADRWVEECLRGSGSLLTPGRPIWTRENAEDFKRRFADAPNGVGSFIDQFRGQLDGAPDGTIQLAAEIVCIHLLPMSASAMGPVAKRQMVRTILGWGTAGVTVPEDLDQAFTGGLLKPGTAYSTNRPRQLSWLTRWLAAWKHLPAEERDAQLTDPWAFRDQVVRMAGVKDRAGPQRRILLHLVHPEAFEAISTGSHTEAIVAAFADRIEVEGDPDKDLLKVRAVLTEQFGPGFDLYRSPVHELWKAEPPVPHPKPSGPTAVPAPSQEPDEDEPEGLRSIADLADRLLMPADHVAEWVDLLQDKRQLVFHGPPGTGKTFIARALARHLGATAEAVDVVQFHASYAYEDFVEGYRPVAGGGFEISQGPLRRLAAKADANPGVAHVLVIDEMNRANLAKVFGELYYLLEYRDEAITLQYSAEPFRLPENLWIIGTMNTADRSIALLDAALRRRFYFVELSPSVEPVASLLPKWLERTGKDHLGWVADVLRQANNLLDDPQAAIGPSYFMRDELDEAWVQRIWRHAVEPLLAEHFYGEEHRLVDFALPGLQAAVGHVPALPPVEPGGNGGDDNPEDDDEGSDRGLSLPRRRLSDVPDGTEVKYRAGRAVVREGMLHLDDGRSFDSATAAAEVFSDGTKTNGWKHWQVEGAVRTVNGKPIIVRLWDLIDRPEEITWLGEEP